MPDYEPKIEFKDTRAKAKWADENVEKLATFLKQHHATLWETLVSTEVKMFNREIDDIGDDLSLARVRAIRECFPNVESSARSVMIGRISDYAMIELKLILPPPKTK